MRIDQLQSAMESGRKVPGCGEDFSTRFFKTADRIIVVNRGRIVEEGSHNMLMSQGGHYAQLYNTYFRHQSPDYKPGEGFVPVLVPLADEASITSQSP